jgi:uncharacterized protein
MKKTFTSATNKSSLLALCIVLMLQVTTAFAQDFKAGINRVNFNSKGTNVVANLNLPPNFSPAKKYVAIVFDGPMTGLKDQVVGVYAKKIAELGYVTLAIDHRYYGESDGTPRQLESTMSKIEDNQEALAYLSALPFVDAQKVGGIGICAGAGIMASSVTTDSKFKFYIGIAGYYKDSTGLSNVPVMQYVANNAAIAKKKYETTKEVTYMPAIWSDPTEPRAAMYALEPTNEPYAYYGTKRGYSPFYVNRIAMQSFTDVLTYDLLSQSDKIKVPVLLIHGTKDLYCTPDAAKKFFDKLKTQKEYFSMETTGHIDLYDQDKYVDTAVLKLNNWLISNAFSVKK